MNDYWKEVFLFCITVISTVCMLGFLTKDLIGVTYTVRLLMAFFISGWTHNALKGLVDILDGGL